jgi:hypothetical protein
VELEANRPLQGGVAAHAAHLARTPTAELEERHHTEAQIAAKNAAKKKGGKQARDAQAPDEFGPWDSDSDEFGSVSGRPPCCLPLEV